MKTILCYGDSNTWGYNPVKNGQRHNYKDRWTTHLQSNLGSDYLVIPEGLNGRTSVWDDPLKNGVNGKDYLIPCLDSHKPIDLVILFLGTNDLKTRLSLPPKDIASGVGTLVDLIKKSDSSVNGSSPKIIVIVPPEVQKLSNFKESFEGSKVKSLEFPKVFKEMANDKGVELLNIGEFVKFSDADGIHFAVDQLETLGDIVAKKVKTII